MDDSIILNVLKMDLDISVPTKDKLLSNMIMLAKDAIGKEGITLDSESVSDCMLVEAYAAFLYRKRKENIPMPRMLRWQLNNRLFSEKASQEDS